MTASDGQIDSAVITRETMVQLLSDTHMEGYYQGIDHGISIIEKVLKLDLSEVRKLATEIAADERKNNGKEEGQGSEAGRGGADSGNDSRSSS